MQLVVAEKPSVARDLARVLGVRAQGRECFEGDACVITWCIGHLVELEEPVAYDTRWKAWRLDSLPMLPPVFRLRPSRHAVAQLRVVTRLLGERRFTHVVNACDAGREGELIFRYVYQHAASRLPVRRLWISSLTDEAIARGFAALRPGADYDPLGDAARSRSEADWLVGMNATRAITVRARATGGDTLYSVGRVQTPTLAMLVAREHEIRAFVPRPYWEVRGQFAVAGGASFTAWWRTPTRGKLVARLATAALAEALVARDAAAGDAMVDDLRARTVREPPPMLFDLTALQRTANRRFGFSAARTLELAQALYERHKVVTYPRTDSRHLTTDLARELPALFGAVVAIPEYAAFAREIGGLSRRFVDDAKVHDHHAIIPTGTAPRTLDRDEARVFDLIARRFLGAFYPDAEFAVTDAWIRVGPAGPTPPFAAVDRETMLAALPPPPDRYHARGRVRVVAGWQEVAGIDGGEPARRDDAANDDALALLPPLAIGQPVRGAYAAVGKQTTPPPRYTEATLLGAMESAGRTVTDEAMRAAMRDTGLGTPATRAAIIETLLRRAFIVRERGALAPTATGIGLIAAIPVASLASPELTGSWEARLARIARREDTRAAFMADIAAYVTEVVGVIREGLGPRASGLGPHAERAREPEPPKPPKPPKPPRVPKPRANVASAAPANDWWAVAKAAMAQPTEAPVPEPKPKPKPPAATAGALGCPRCKRGELVAGKRGWGCSRWREDCRFVLSFETAGKRISLAQLRDLVTRGKTRKARFVANGASVDGRLVLDVDGAQGARFEPG